MNGEENVSEFLDALFKCLGYDPHQVTEVHVQGGYITVSENIPASAGTTAVTRVTKHIIL